MLVVLPVCSYDASLALQNLELCERFDGQAPFDCLLHSPIGLDVEGIRKAAERCFLFVACNTYNDWPGSRKFPNTVGVGPWPQAANWAWQHAARVVASQFKRPWFWWEQDATPLRPGWLDAIWSAYKEGQKPFAGYVVNGDVYTYLNGVAIYPPHVAKYAPMAMRVQDSPFDVVGGHCDKIHEHATPLNDILAFDPRHRNVTFYERSELKDLKGKVLFHPCKDGSLYELLMGREGPVRPVLDVAPSYLEQTPWPTGMFAFPPDPRTVYFNPGLVEHEGVLSLFARRYRFPNGLGKIPMINDLSIWRLNPQLTPIECLVPEPPRRWEKEQWEDPRVISHKGGIYVAQATWVHQKAWTIRQSLVKLSDNWRKFSVVFEPRYGGNAPDPPQANGHEKNWSWFVHDGAWHFIYQTNPMTVVRLNPNGNIKEVFKNLEATLPWEYGQLRGGTPPVCVANEYVTFFHSSLPWKGHQRRYYMGALTFSASPPFPLLRITEKPLLVGSEKDTRVLGGPLVIFPCGAILRQEDWLVTFGVNDEACGWVRIPEGDLRKRFKSI